VSTARLSIDLAAPGMPQHVTEILDKPSENRTDEERSAAINWYATIDPDWQRLNQAVLEHQAKAPRPTLAKAMISSEGLPPVRLNTQGADFLEQTYFLRRGDPNLKDAVAAQGFLQVLTPSGDGAGHWQASPPAGWRTSYRRRALADWLTDVDRGAGTLLAHRQAHAQAAAVAEKPFRIDTHHHLSSPGFIAEITGRRTGQVPLMNMRSIRSGWTASA
jgi:hypothetical protein